MLSQNIVRQTKSVSIRTAKRSLASGGSPTKSLSDAPEGAPSSTPAKQSFVQARIQAGEWDPKRSDPFYRPKFKSRAKILSLEDFANRPAVGFSGEFASFTDAMVTLSWIDHRQQEQIYQLYLELQKHAQDKHGVTSHEYVTRVIAQKYNLSQTRVAAIIQLQHNEQQYRREGRELLTEAAEYMDAAIQQEIKEAYQAHDLKPPDEFVEDPIGIAGELQERKQWRVAEDVFDVDQLLADAAARDEREMRLAIDGHHYLEDKEDEAIKIPLSKDAKKLLKRHEKLSSSIPPPDKAIDWPAPADGQKRNRWKFVAQVVNTRDLKRKHMPNRSYTNNSPENTLVEHDGVLRVGTMADAKLASWKPTRNVLEKTYEGVKKGWLDRNVHGIESAWGKAPKLVVKPKEEKINVKSADDVNDNKLEAEIQDNTESDLAEKSENESENAK